MKRIDSILKNNHQFKMIIAEKINKLDTKLPEDKEEFDKLVSLIKEDNLLTYKLINLEYDLT